MRCAAAISRSSARASCPSRTPAPRRRRPAPRGAAPTGRGPRRGRRHRRTRARRGARRRSRTLTRLERAQVAAAEDVRSAACTEPERLAHGHGLRPASAARSRQCLLDVGDEVAALVRRRAVDPEPDGTPASIIAHRRNPGPEPQVRVGQCANSGAGRAEGPHVLGQEMDAVRTQTSLPASRAARGTRPDGNRRSSAVLLLLDGLGQMRVQPQAQAPRERRAPSSAASRRRRASRARPRSASAPGLPRVARGALRCRPGPRPCPPRGRRAGAPPRDSPTSIEPREATIRTPSSRAAWISASTRPARPGGKT